MKSKQAVMRLAEQEYAYTIRRSRRARRLLLHVDINGSIELVLPWRASYVDGHMFVHEKRQWIAEQMVAQSQRAKSVPRRSLRNSSSIPYLGSDIRLLVSLRSGKSVLRHTGSTLHVMATDTDHVRVAIERWYRKQAKLFFAEQVAMFSQVLGVQPGYIRITNARTRWGSCNTQTKNLSFTWRLMLANREVGEYVAAHEVAHIVHPGHGKQFWATVADLYPIYEVQKQYLRDHGYKLEL